MRRSSRREAALGARCEAVARGAYTHRLRSTASRVVYGARSRNLDAPLDEDLLELLILIDQLLLVLGDCAEDFFQSEDLIFQRLDVQLLSLAVGTIDDQRLVRLCTLSPSCVSRADTYR